MAEASPGTGSRAVATRAPNVMPTDFDNSNFVQTAGSVQAFFTYLCFGAFAMQHLIGAATKLGLLELLQRQQDFAFTDMGTEV